MAWLRALLCGWILVATIAPAVALGIDGKTVKLETIELPVVSVDGLNYASLRAELAYSDISVGAAEVRQTTSICVPKGSKNPLKDAIEVPTHYYEVPFRVSGGAMVVRDRTGAVIHARGFDELESTERFGHDDCRYWLESTLQKDWREKRAGFRKQIESSARESFLARAQRELDHALFFNIVEERVPVYRFKDKKRDYTDLNEAAELARQAYEAMDRSIAGHPQAGREDLEHALAIWELALEESDVNEKQARINRKVTVKLHVSIGVAHMMLGDETLAVRHLQKATSYGMVTSNSKGTGTGDLLERAARRKGRERRNSVLPSSQEALDRLIAGSERYRERIPVEILPTTELVRLRSEQTGHTVGAVVERVEAERTEREEAIASGEVNPYEHLVGRTSMQGFYLFLTPYPDKLASFPAEVCELTQLNQLRMRNHAFASMPEQCGKLTSLKLLDLSGNNLEKVPESIGSLESLKKLNLSGNRIQTLPEEIGRLENLEELTLKDNPLAPGEVDRLKELLPRCKIKV